MPDLGQLTFLAPIKREVLWSDMPVLVEYLPNIVWSFEVTTWPWGTFTVPGSQFSEEQVDRAIKAAELARMYQGGAGKDNEDPAGQLAMSDNAHCVT
jgi:hypothetical protein